MKITAITKENRLGALVSGMSQEKIDVSIASIKGDAAKSKDALHNSMN